MAEVMIATRIAKPLHERILRRRRQLKAQTGIQPSVSAVVRLLLEEATAANENTETKGGAKSPR